MIQLPVSCESSAHSQSGQSRLDSSSLLGLQTSIDRICASID